METTGSQPEARAVSFVQGDVISHSMLVSRQWDPYLSAARAPSLRRAGVPSRVWASCWLRAGAVEWPRSHHGLSSFGGPLEKPGGHRTGGHPIFFSSKLRLGSKTLGAPRWVRTLGHGVHGDPGAAPWRRGCGSGATVRAPGGGPPLWPLLPHLAQALQLSIGATEAQRRKGPARGDTEGLAFPSPVLSPCLGRWGSCLGTPAVKDGVDSCTGVNEASL